MGRRNAVWGCRLLTLSASLLVTSAAFADAIVGSPGASLQSWSAGDLDQDGKPYWDNRSLDGNKKNVGYFLVDALTAQLPGAPGAIPFWGYSYNSSRDVGGTADLNFYFSRSTTFSIADLELEVAAQSNVNAFGWYDISQPTVLHQIFSGPDSAPDTNVFAPSANYGFYLKTGSQTFYTQSSLNTGGDTSHQHFAVFEQSSQSGPVFWIGMEDQTIAGLDGNEGGYGDYNDMLVRITEDSLATIPEPSACALALGGIGFMLTMLRRRRK